MFGSPTTSARTEIGNIFSAKGQMVNHLGFAGHMVSLTNSYSLLI